MADVGGVLFTLPGSCRNAPEGQKCDDCGAPAVVRMQGETDSFGAEFADLCTSCLKKAKEGNKQQAIGNCEWCKKSATDLAPTRDMDEGMSGPVYFVCSECRSRQADAAAEELAWYERNRFYEDDY